MKPSLYSKLATEHEIRLVKLLPSRKECTRIRCDLTVVSLLSIPDYEALSWCWGMSSPEREIKVQNVLRSISTNLEQALRQLRYEDKPRILWIDALCINQDDLMERAAQVSIMSQIYKLAKVVVVWLGPMPLGQHLNTFDALRQFGQGVSVFDVYEDYSTCPSVETDDTKSYQEDWDHKDRAFLAQLSSVFEVEWWDRLWVVQEVTVATSVQIQWGASSMSFGELLRCSMALIQNLGLNLMTAAETLGERSALQLLGIISHRMRSVDCFQTLYFELQQADWSTREKEFCFVLIELLAACRVKSATDPRDKVYGILGLLPPVALTIIKPSYTVSTADVFCDLAYRILCLTKSFMLFRCKARLGLSSWIPDWSDRFHHSEDWRLLIKQNHLFAASHDVQWSLNLMADKSIQLMGLRLDLISMLHGQPILLTGAAQYYEFLYSSPWQIKTKQELRVNQSVVVEDIAYISGGSLYDALLRTTVNDCAPRDEMGEIGRAREQDIARVNEWYRTMCSAEDHHGPEIIKYSQQFCFDNSSVSVFSLIQRTTRGKMFLETEMGYIGLTTKDSCAVGDEIWILAGGSHPVVLQPIKDRPGCYRARSEAYVQGVMDGEAVRGECPIISPIETASIPLKQRLRPRKGRLPDPQWVDIRIY